MKKIIFTLSIFSLLLIFVGLNLGKWMDATQEPVKSDIVVCLGGGTIERVKRSIELLEQGYTRHDTFLLLGESWYNQPYIKKNYPNLPIVIEERPENTAEEIQYTKQYMKEHGYKSALIVTDPPHSRRVSLLTTLVSVEGDENMNFMMIDSGVIWWDRDSYYKNKVARLHTLDELLKVGYNFIAYGILDKIGALDNLKEFLEERKK